MINPVSDVRARWVRLVTPATERLLRARRIAPERVREEALWHLRRLEDGSLRVAEIGAGAVGSSRHHGWVLLDDAAVAAVDALVDAEVAAWVRSSDGYRLTLVEGWAE